MIYPVDSAIQRLNNPGQVDNAIYLLNNRGQINFSDFLRRKQSIGRYDVHARDSPLYLIPTTMGVVGILE